MEPSDVKRESPDGQEEDNTAELRGIKTVGDPIGPVELVVLKTETKKSDNDDKGSSSKIVAESESKYEMQQILRVKLDDCQRQLKMLERMIPKIGDSERKNALQLYLDDMKPSLESTEALLGKFKFEEKDFSKIVENMKNVKSAVLDRLSFEKKMIIQDKRKK
ncbi:predicted protein [Arabidopsis lyrata subsp. lyrata]|uniref:Predicted protein n=1 Tax=Arabidopsis lyrata subsp. lyrata TaxID=81972 RepID=D7KMA6_ARALL|nr:uncharacterized protein LOC9330572 isoform X2 [Arabidopsis lyrata subsp. lyrata]EFH68098.1 predicted protein [Arabidopsis lyrata subsp. lyrata]|eukprot:XP_002891839.1 uncharacterized protein LOC9330572 isoform X2 [Arabidopsis lyrata subsp. lyrata]